MNAKRQCTTQLTELTETHNLALSLRRLRGPPYDDERWKRAFYHALCMEIDAYDTRKKIREALELP